MRASRETPSVKTFVWRLARRVIGGLAMILVVASFTFFLIHWLPGDPVQTRLETLVQQGVPLFQAREEVQSMYGFVPHQPLTTQYVHYLGQLAHLDLGQSISYTGVPVSHLLLSAAPWTVLMVLSGLVISFIIGVLAGVFAAVKRASRVGSGVTLLSTFLHGIPQFILALLLAYLFTTLWPIFPFGAPYDAAIRPGVSWPFLSSLGVHAVLPVLAYAISGYGGWALTMKSNVVSVLGDDFILASELRGIAPRIRFWYIARNAILPLFTVFALSLGFLFGGAIFIEQIFDYPGLGYMLLQSLGARDYPLMSAAFLVITVAVIVSNILADLLYTAIDPRIRR